jgi:IS1 family transposase
MNQLSTEKRAAVIAALVEGNSLRGTARMTGVARMTVEKLLRELGAACAAHHDATVRGLNAQRIQCDEIWAFIGAKKKNVPESKRDEWGDCWTWTALDPDSKLMVAYRVGPRTQDMAYDFMEDVASRLNNRVQITTDGFTKYPNAVEYAFGPDVDYAQIEKHYKIPAAAKAAAVRYSPTRLASVQRARITGNPDPRYISTSHVERQNLTMRMHMRRFARLTNGFSRKIEMHFCAIALHFAYYNFCKIHQTIRITPAMQAGISDHVWEISELIDLLTTSSDAEALTA